MKSLIQVLEKAFQGELTIEWRSKNPSLVAGDNSAERLLEKIKHKQEEVKISKKKQANPKKKTGTRKLKVIIPILEALEQANKAVSASELLIQSGYRQNANTEQIERFFLDIRHQLNENKISCERKDNEDYFMLIDNAN